MTRHYPFSCKRILANWEHMAHSLVKECLNSVMLAEGHDLQAYRKINPDDLDIVIPMLERARSTLLAKQLYK